MLKQLAGGADHVTVNLSGLTFADSNSIQALVPAARTLQGRGGDIILPSPQPIVARMLSLPGADQMIQVQLGAGTRPEADRPSDRVRHRMSRGCQIGRRPQARGRPGT